MALLSHEVSEATKSRKVTGGQLSLTVTTVTEELYRVRSHFIPTVLLDLGGVDSLGVRYVLPTLVERG